MPEKTVETAPAAVEEAEGEMNSGVVEEKKNQYYCKECRKSFNSGKALGGHLSSAHVQSKNDYSLGVKKGHNSLGSPARNYCVLCGREFSSSKALFGHMRSHPERQWRGMDPPAAVVEGSDNGGEVSAPLPPMADIASSLKCWSVTAKRGRPEIAKPAAGLLAFQNLMKFVENHKEKKNDEVEDVGSSSLVADSHQFKKQKTESAIDVAEEKLIEAETEAESTIDVAEEKLTEPQTEAEAEKKTQENSTTSNRQNYVCTTCNRSFHSHQALGGHKSSHNKLKIRIIDQTGGVRSGNNNNNNNVVSRRQPGSHVCKICGMSLSSGQALGRHKRSHKEEDEKKKKKNESGRVEEFEIDLNKLPGEM